LIRRGAPAMTHPMNTRPYVDWLAANSDRLILGTLIAASIVAAMLVLRWIGEKIVARDPDRLTWQGVVGSVLARTGVLFMIAAAIDIVMSYADAPPRIAHVTDILFIIAAALQAAVWARELIIGAISRRVGEHPGETTLGNAMAIIRVLVSVALFAIAIIVILDNLGVNVTALIAGFGIGGIAIGLAAQGIFSDLFAALAIVFDRPFRRGDTIRFDTTTGTVERIGLKTTRLRSLSGEQVIMANTKLLEREIHNLADAGGGRRVTLTFGLVYQTPPAKLRQIEALAKAAVEAERGCKLVRCLVIALGPSSLDHELVWDDKAIEPDTLARHRAAIVLALLKAFAREGITFAYPTQTTFTAAPDGTLVMPWAALPTSKPSKT
jgi:small-conductance mechanosensitive channel